MTGTFTFPRVQAIPQPRRASLRLDGIERLAYDFGAGETRPFVYPVIGPSGACLTRMGHPNPIGHEHHKSVWFGHQSVAGVNFWEDRPASDIRIRHRGIRLYHDGMGWGGLVAELDWWAHGRTLLTQTLTIVLVAERFDGYSIDLQSRFEVPGSSGPIELGRTNFGFLGVRVASTLSEQFGGGRLIDADGRSGASEIFGHSSRWVDYSGPSLPGKVEGLCYMDHPSNPHHPTHWHVRGDGWMEAAFNLASSSGLAKGHPLDLRYRLQVHVGHGERRDLELAWSRFAETPAYTIIPPRGQSLAELHRGPVA